MDKEETNEERNITEIRLSTMLVINTTITHTNSLKDCDVIVFHCINQTNKTINSIEWQNKK
ncbi:hypothetical protein BLOT_001266 [Blomia tropicalis]|nr:hypothetical protein BLOT_001266 [Blomia tropicalis]